MEYRITTDSLGTDNNKVILTITDTLESVCIQIDDWDRHKMKACIPIEAIRKLLKIKEIT